MYYDKIRQYNTRNDLTFKYLGKQIVDQTLKMFTAYTEQEMNARNKTAKYLNNPKIHHDDKRVMQEKDNIVRYGKLREQCAVWHHEFTRTPDREFVLTTNDIDFFSLVDVVSRFGTGTFTKRTEWKYHYVGNDLIEPIEKKIVSIINEHKGLLNAIKRKVDDIFNDTDYDELSYQNELCHNNVLLHEFKNRPDYEVTLSLGDIVYFNLAPLLTF